jgi:hypothetical protein
MPDDYPPRISPKSSWSLISSGSEFDVRRCENHAADSLCLDIWREPKVEARDCSLMIP